MIQSLGLVAPWPDASRGGHNVYKLTLTDNVTKYEQRGIFVDHESAAAQSAKAAKILGVKEVEFEPIGCCQLFYTTEIMHRVERIAYELEIDTAFLHYNSDMNQDHVEASRICMTALRHCRDLLMYQSNGYILEKDYYPRFFVDISKTIEKKREALACYNKEHDRYGRLFGTACKRDEIWGYGNEVKAAEGFHVVKMMF